MTPCPQIERAAATVLDPPLYGGLNESEAPEQLRRVARVLVKAKGEPLLRDRAGRSRGGIVTAVRPRRVLVTGAAGFLGSHLCRRLLRDGRHGAVVALDRGAERSDALAALGPAVTRVGGDIRDPEVLARCLADVDLVFHLAGIADPRACERDPATARAVNVDGTAAVVRAASGRRLVFLSSASTYLAAPAAPVDENAAVGEASTYGATKLAAERLCLDAARAGDLDAIVVRNFNTYGGGQGPTFLVPELVERALRHGRIEVASCRPVRDFTYVDDTVAALVALGSVAVSGEIFNLGSGHAIAVGDVALALGHLLDVPVSCAHTDVGGNPHLVADNSKLRNATGWAPAVDLSDGLARTIDWFRERLPA